MKTKKSIKKPIGKIPSINLSKGENTEATASGAGGSFVTGLFSEPKRMDSMFKDEQPKKKVKGGFVSENETGPDGSGKFTEKMKMDVYKQVDYQDSNTGALKREWQYDRSMACHAKGVISNSASTRTGDKQVLSNRYTNDQILQIRTTEKVSLREKITNILGSDGTSIWVEANFPTDTPTVFEVMGSTPMTDPFGTVVGYNTTVKRSENQTIGY